MRIDPVSHLIVGAKYIASPNFDARPSDCLPDLIVIHNISLPPGQFGGSSIEDLFCNCLDVDAHEYFAEIGHLKVSSHLLIKRDGELIQFVPFEQRAWHAGESQYQTRMACNDFSIGIELEGTDDTPFEDAQYEVLSMVIHSLLMAYPSLSKQLIVGHSDIAPGRKTDPGPSFDWARLKRSL